MDIRKGHIFAERLIFGMLQGAISRAERLLPCYFCSGRLALNATSTFDNGSPIQSHGNTSQDYQT